LDTIKNFQDSNVMKKDQVNLHVFQPKVETFLQQP